MTSRAESRAESGHEDRDRCRRRVGDRISLDSRPTRRWATQPTDVGQRAASRRSCHPPSSFGSRCCHDLPGEVDLFPSEFSTRPHEIRQRRRSRSIRAASTANPTARYARHRPRNIQARGIRATSTWPRRSNIAGFKTDMTLGDGWPTSCFTRRSRHLPTSCGETGAVTTFRARLIRSRHSASSVANA
jgi:hypothetical protein